MSKKNRYKFRQRPNTDNQNGSVSETNFTTNSVSASPSPAAVSNSNRNSVSSNAMNAHVAEYQIISKDLIRLIVLNGLMLAAVLAIYFTNRTSGYLERMFQHLLR